MAMLLRKAWATMVNRSNSDFSETQLQSSAGINQLPSDVFWLVLKFLGPKEAAKLSLICKSWKVLVSDNRLWEFFLQNQSDSWDSIVFAETRLRSGYPIQSYTNRTSQLPFIQIYRQRAQLSGSIIIDGRKEQPIGSPLGVFPTGLCDRAAIETMLQLNTISSGEVDRATASLVGANSIARPDGRQHSWNLVTSSLHCIQGFDISLQQFVAGETVYTAYCTIICHSDDMDAAEAARRQLREAIYSVLYDMNVPAVCAIDQAILALYAARYTSGIVVNIGFQVTSVVPILQGKVMHEVGVEIVGQGALKLTGFLSELMQQKGMNLESLYTVRTLKEKLCYVAADYEAELLKDTEASFEVLGEGLFTLSKERFQTGEILFQPRIGGVRTMGLHQAVALCMDHCLAAEVTPDDGWFKTVVLAGGSSCLPGLPERLEKELIRLLPQSMSKGVKVIPPSHGVDSAWFGAKLISNVSTFNEAWCLTKKQFRRQARRRASFISS